MKGKKGFFLAEETIRLIVGALILVSLIAVLAFLYYSSQQDQELKFAERSLKYLVERLEAGDKEIILFGPKEWHLIVNSACKNLENVPCMCLQEGLGFGNSPGEAKKSVCIKNDLNIKIYHGETVYEEISSGVQVTCESAIMINPPQKLWVKSSPDKKIPYILTLQESGSLDNVEFKEGCKSEVVVSPSTSNGGGLSTSGTDV